MGLGHLVHSIIKKNVGNFGFWDALIRSTMVDSLWGHARAKYGDDNKDLPSVVFDKIGMWDYDLTIEKYVEACMEMQVIPEITFRGVGT